MRHTALVLCRRMGGHVPLPSETQSYGFVLQTCLLRHTQQTCLLRDTADMSAVSHSRPVCCVTRSRHVCWVTQQSCLLCDTAYMSVSHSRHVCCVTQLNRNKRSYCLFGSSRTAKAERGVTLPFSMTQIEMLDTAELLARVNWYK